jgi:hypothetical protein
MAVIAHIVLKGVTKEQYDAVRTECGWMDKAPDGAIAHMTWWDGNDNHNVDAWESEEAFGHFGADLLGPAMAKVGVITEPETTFYEAHEVFLPNATTLTVS